MTESAWWWKIQTPDDGAHFYPSGYDPATGVPGDEQARVLAAHSVPAGWVDLGEGWDVALTTGPLHPSTVADPASHIHDTVPA